MDFGWPNIEIDCKMANGRLIFSTGFCLKIFQTGLRGYVFLLFRACRSQLLAEHSALWGMGFMGLFVYKYIADKSFVMISCVDTGGFVSHFVLETIHNFQHFHKRVLFLHTPPPTQKRTIKNVDWLNLFHVQVQ